MSVKSYIGILIILNLFLLLLLESCSLDSDEAESNSLKVKAVFEVIGTRRTVREFQGTSVPQEHIIKILDAARYAPTAGNVQPWKFVVIQKRSRLESLSELLQTSWEQKIKTHPELEEEKRNLYVTGGKEAIQKAMTAPVYIIVLVDTSVYPQYALYDGCLAVENLMLAARSMGYGTGFFTTYFEGGVVKSFLNAPENLKFICATPLGIPLEWPPMPEKKYLEEFIVYESFDEE
ncbi:MAG: hypothetical protein AMJ90_00950 [candidate division Zixibacteria bacterium SM23_73_2]|nr:MAG: hypothetical protein AMJ90_00950 [candidate division Zixibacteria bacterium SM23_73_2]